MKTSERFENAVKKLYNAFHSGTLIPECYKQCAVGNICDNADSWKHLTDNHGSTTLNYVGLVNERLGRKINGYKPSQLIRIEASFLRGCGYSLPLSHSSFRPKDPTSQDVLFDGLCETIVLLCEIEGIPDIMDFSNIFDYEPKSLELNE